MRWWNSILSASSKETTSKEPSHARAKTWAGTSLEAGKAPEKVPAVLPLAAPANVVANTSAFTYAQLKAPGPYPPGIDTMRREEYLSPSEFSSVFGITVENFSVLPKWKKNQQKKARGLF